MLINVIGTFILALSLVSVDGHVNEEPMQYVAYDIPGQY